MQSISYYVGLQKSTDSLIREIKQELSQPKLTPARKDYLQCALRDAQVTRQTLLSTISLARKRGVK